MKTFEEFLKDVKSSAELKAKLEAAVADAKTAEEKTAAVVKLAQENGYEVSVEDLSGQDAGKRKLDDEELQVASGGWFFGVFRDCDEWCLGSYGCATTLAHACESDIRAPIHKA